jgi:hypothetical protein
MDWRCGSSGRAPALQAQSPEFKPWSYQKRKEGRREKEKKKKEEKKISVEEKNCSFYRKFCCV